MVRRVLRAWLKKGAGDQAARASGKVWRIGFLNVTSASAGPGGIEAFRQGLRDVGYEEGKNLVIEYRYAEGNLARLGVLATELVRLNVDIIFTPYQRTRAP
jgi:putative ABC transport system substrate-binding protein